MGRLLLIDDNGVIQLTLSALLEGEGFEVVSAESWSEAEERLNTPERFEFVVLDRQLGDDDGLTLLPIIRQHNPSARVIVVSGTPMEEMPHGANGYVSKGGAFQDLLREINGSGDTP